MRLLQRVYLFTPCIIVINIHPCKYCIYSIEGGSPRHAFYRWYVCYIMPVPIIFFWIFTHFHGYSARCWAILFITVLNLVYFQKEILQHQVEHNYDTLTLLVHLKIYRLGGPNWGKNVFSRFRSGKIFSSSD